MRNDFENAIRRKEKISLAAEVLLSNADEIADSLAFGVGGEDGFLKESVLQSEDFLKAYTEAKNSLLFGSSLPESTPEETSGFLSSFREKSNCFITVYLLSAFCRKRADAGEGLALSRFLDGEGEPENSKIAYMRNAFSDTAYGVFSKWIKDASVTYPSSFAAVCEEVYYGRAGYCILPYESSEEGVLSGFRRLISKYELKPVLTCSVTTDFSVQSTTRFVLLSKSAMRIAVRSGRRTCEYLKINVGGPQNDVLERVLFAASLNGLSCVKTESIPLPWDEGSYSSDITLSLDGADPVPFLLYLRLEVPECEIEGVYTDIGGD